MTPKEAYETRPIKSTNGLSDALQVFLAKASSDFVARASRLDENVLRQRFQTDLIWVDSPDESGERLEALRHMGKPFALVRSSPDGSDPEIHVTDERTARIAAESAREALPAPTWRVHPEDADVPLGRDAHPKP